MADSDEDTSSVHRGISYNSTKFYNATPTNCDQDQHAYLI
jgi:hypothetical protein